MAATTRPVITARAPATSIGVVEEPTDTPTTTAAITGARDESGPSTSTREGPNTAYATSGTIVAYRPVIAGSPAASA